MSKDIIYKATINTGNTQDTKNYIGMTSNTFKERYRNHSKSFTRKKYSNETELGKPVWHLKNKTDFTIKWSIIKKDYFLHGRIQKMSLMFGGKLFRPGNTKIDFRSTTKTNKERNACYLNNHTPTFFLKHKRSSEKSRNKRHLIEEYKDSQLGTIATLTNNNQQHTNDI